MFFVYINLKSRSFKNKHVHAMLSNLNVNFERFDAIRPNLEDIDLTNVVPRIKNYLKDEKKKERGLGVIGCYLSHYNVLKKYREINEDYLCILEDDVVINYYTIKKINKVIDFFKDNKIDWDIIRSLKQISIKNEIIKFDDLKIYKFVNNNKESKYKDENFNDIHSGTHFQIINVENIDKIIDFLDNEYIFNIDSVYSTNKINVYWLSDNNLRIRLPDNLTKQTNIPKI